MKEQMRVTAFLIAAMASGYVGGMMSQSATKAAGFTGNVIRANKFELVDTKGKVHGLFGAVKGEYGLMLSDATGKHNAEVVARDK